MSTSNLNNYTLTEWGLRVVEVSNIGDVLGYVLNS